MRSNEKAQGRAASSRVPWSDGLGVWCTDASLCASTKLRAHQAERLELRLNDIVVSNVVLPGE